MNKACFLLWFMVAFGFSQNLEERIYVATENFIANQNPESLKKLNTQAARFKTQVKTKAEQLALVFLQCHKGYYLNKNSRLNEAISTYEDALNRFNGNRLEGYSDFDIIENCLKPLGNLYTVIGDFTNAESTIKQYIFFAEKNKNTAHQISGAINLAILYKSVNKHETVLKIIDDTFKFPNLSNAQKRHLLNLKVSSLMDLNKYDEALTINNNSLFSGFNKHQNHYRILLKRGDYNNALTALKKAKKVLYQANLNTRYLAKFYVEEAQLYHLLKETDNAVKSLYQAINTLLPNFKNDELPNKADLYAENTFIDIFDLLAEMESDPEKALQSFDLSFYVSQLLQHHWTAQQTTIIHQTNNRIRSEKCIDILYHLFITTKNKAHLFKALQYAENSKASSLKTIFQKKMRLREHPNDSLLQKELSLLKEQEHITSQLVLEQLDSNRASKINALSAKLSKTSHEVKLIQKRIQKKYPDHTDVFSLKTLQSKLLEDDAVLVEYFFGEHTLYQFVVSNRAIQLNPIGLNAETKKQILDFIHLFDDAAIINSNIKNFTHKAFGLYKTLNLEQIQSTKNIVVVPDGLLNFLPFETLLSAQTSTASFSKMPFLIKQKNIVYNSSAYFYLTKNDNLPIGNELLGMFPIFKNTNRQLTYSINEALAIEDEMPSSILLNKSATKANFIQKADNYNILHLSTHANSGDFIKPAHIDFYDATLYLNELYSLNLNSDLVVLSACETGVGKLYKGEGAMSIARGFQYAGAKNLLFSLWQINDLSTAQVMQSFYKNFNQWKSASYSNRQSKLDYLQNNAISNIKKSPYYWGAFVYYGALKPKKSQNTILYIFFGFLIVSIIVFLTVKFRG